MKIMLKPLLVLFTIALFTSCNVNVKAINGSGNVITQNRNLSGFNSIKVSSGMDVTLEQSQTYDVIVEADDNVQPHIITKIENGTLIIGSDFNSFSDVTMNVTVKMPAVKGIDAGSGTTVESKNTMLGEDVAIDASSGSTVEIDIESDKISAHAGSGSTLTLRGKALSFDISSGSGSNVEAENLIANNIIAQASSGSSISVHPAVSLNAKASSGASIDYIGNPTNVTVDEGSGGSVTKQQ